MANRATKLKQVQEFQGTSPPNNGDVPTWNSSTDKYEPVTPSAVALQILVTDSDSGHVVTDSISGDVVWDA